MRLRREATGRRWCPSLKLLGGRGLSDFQAGAAFADLHGVALGSKIVAEGEIPARSLDEFRRFVSDSCPTLAIRIRQHGERVAWSASRFVWALDALDWLRSQSSASIGSHLHWMQGLLFGYSPEAIDDYLARLCAPASSSPPSSLLRTAGTESAANNLRVFALRSSVRDLRNAAARLRAFCYDQHAAAISGTADALSASARRIERGEITSGAADSGKGEPG